MLKRWLMALTASFLMSGCMVAGMVLAAQPAAPSRGVQQRFSGLWLPKMDREPYGDVLINKLPKGTHILIDTGPVPELPIGDYGGLKVNQRAKDEVKNFNPSEHRKVAGACVPPSMTYIMQSPFPTLIEISPEIVVIQHEYYDMVRIVYMDGRKHPSAEAPPTKAGHSIGHWEGEELVVDTTHVASGTMLNNGFNHSDAIHVVERFRVSPDRSTLWVTQMYEDPAVFEGRAARYISFRRGPANGFLYPYDCVPDYAE